MSQREIKFRAWDKILQCWSKNTICFYINNKGIIVPEIGDRYELVEYIGLNDKNGVEIYGGDIYKVGDFFINGPLTFCWPKQDGTVLEGTDRLRCNEHPGKNSVEFTATDARNCEVIGNIYQNPELLEGAQ